jgi:cyclin-dependent kinase-like
VLHRDIKPENLLVNADLSLKICDFGFARLMPRDSPLTDYVATRWYRAPELLLGSTQYGKTVDMWAIGCIMGELVDGQPLFPGESEIDQLFLIQKTLGPLTQEQNELFLKNPRFVGLKFPDMSRPETLLKRYVGQLTKPAMNFMKSVLVMEPNLRLTSAEAGKHSYFEGLPRTPAREESRPSSSKAVSRTVTPANGTRPTRESRYGAGFFPAAELQPEPDWEDEERRSPSRQGVRKKDPKDAERLVGKRRQDLENQPKPREEEPKSAGRRKEKGPPSGNRTTERRAKKEKPRGPWDGGDTDYGLPSIGPEKPFAGGFGFQREWWPENEDTDRGFFQREYGAPMFHQSGANPALAPMGTAPHSQSRWRPHEPGGLTPVSRRAKPRDSRF